MAWSAFVARDLASADSAAAPLKSCIVREQAEGDTAKRLDTFVHNMRQAVASQAKQ